MFFYTNVRVHRGKILFRGISDGKRILERYDFSPTLYTPDINGKFKDFHGNKFSAMEFNRIYDARQFIKDYGSNENAKVYGMRSFEYAFIDSMFEEYEHIDYDASKIRVARIDIEVDSSEGFPHAEQAEQEINAITVKLDDTFHTWGLKDYKVEDNDVKYYQFSSEIDLLRDFLFWWGNNYPDIVTGWNVVGFDVKYIVNRIRKILGEEAMKKLSPWNVVEEKRYKVRGYDVESYDLMGIELLDSIELYWRFSPKGKSQDSYKLDDIGLVALKRKKVDYSEYGNLSNLYEKNHQLYIKYNIGDVRLDEDIANKYDLINLALSVSYMNRVNYGDVFMQVRMWQAIVNRILLKEGIVLDFGKDSSKVDYSGGYVKEPQIGMFDWVVSFDLTSLYPHLIMQYNISPETLVEPEDYTPEMKRILGQRISVQTMLNEDIDTSGLKALKLGLTPNKQLFRNDVQGVMPRIMETMYKDRKKYKKLQIKCESEAETATTKEEVARLKAEASKYKSLQMALKVCLNSAYGAMGSNYFVLYDIRLAEAITSSGRLAIQWIGKKTNEYLQNLLGTEKNYVVAQDTDSMYITMDDFVKRVFKNKDVDRTTIINFLDNISDSNKEGSIQKKIDQIFNELKEYTNAHSQKMIMKREVISPRGFWTGKKRYALDVYDSEGVRYKEPEIKIVGLESVRSSTPTIAREKIEKLTEIVLRQGRDEAQKFIAQMKREWHTFPLDEIAVPTGVNGLEKYTAPVVKDRILWTKGAQAHVKSALIYNNWLEENGHLKTYPTIKSGDKIRYIYLKNPNPLHYDLIAYEHDTLPLLEIDDYIDYKKLFTKFEDPAKRIMEAVGWTVTKQISLMDFMEEDDEE